MDKKYTIISERLGLRPWTDLDESEFAKLNADPKVMEFFPNTLDKKQNNNLVNRLKKHYVDHGFTGYVAEILSTNEFIGYIGFMTPKFDTYFTPCVEIGWRLKASSWNQGFATEGAKACLQYGFNILNFSKIFSWTSVINIPSERVMQKIGLKHIGNFNHPNIKEGDRLEEHVLYCLRREEYDRIKEKS